MSSSDEGVAQAHSTGETSCNDQELNTAEDTDTSQSIIDEGVDLTTAFNLMESTVNDLKTTIKNLSNTLEDESTTQPVPFTHQSKAIVLLSRSDLILVMILTAYCSVIVTYCSFHERSIVPIQNYLLATTWLDFVILWLIMFVRDLLFMLTGLSIVLVLLLPYFIETVTTYSIDEHYKLWSPTNRLQARRTIIVDNNGTAEIQINTPLSFLDQMLKWTSVITIRTLIQSTACTAVLIFSLHLLMVLNSLVEDYLVQREANVLVTICQGFITFMAGLGFERLVHRFIQDSDLTLHQLYEKCRKIINLPLHHLYQKLYKVIAFAPGLKLFSSDATTPMPSSSPTYVADDDEASAPASTCNHSSESSNRNFKTLEEVTYLEKTEEESASSEPYQSDVDLPLAADPNVTVPSPSSRKILRPSPPSKKILQPSPTTLENCDSECDCLSHGECSDDETGMPILFD